MSKSKVELLSDHRARVVGKRGQKPEGKVPVLLPPDIFPGPQKLERARIINELAEAWGIDLALVVAIAAGRLGKP